MIDFVSELMVVKLTVVVPRGLLYSTQNVFLYNRKDGECYGKTS